MNTCGGGKIYYLGTSFCPPFYVDLFRAIASDIGLEALATLPEGVQLSIRKKGELRYLFLLNLQREPATVPLRKPHRSSLTGRVFDDSVLLDAYGVEILRAST